MRSRIARPSPALVVSTIALIVALGGTSYAAFSLPNNSVGTKQLKNASVGTFKLKSGAVGTGKLKDGAVTTAKLKNVCRPILRVTSLIRTAMTAYAHWLET